MPPIREIPGRWHLRQLRIGVRLRLAFASVMAMMLVGCSVSLWYFRGIRTRADNVSRIEQRMTAVLQLRNSVLTLMNDLHRTADTRRGLDFEREARRSLTLLRSDNAWVAGVLRGSSRETDRQAVILNSLLGVYDALPSRVDALTELARAGDWAALHARLLDQVDHTDDVVSVLVRQIDADLLQVREGLIDDIRQARRRTLQALALTGMLSLIAAAVLGIVVTRSITRPLASLDAGARALAEGRFDYQIAVVGSDELAHLAGVFNGTARQLQDLYAKLRISEAQFRALIEKASELIAVVSRTGEVLYASPSSARVLGYPPEMLVGRSIRDFVHSEETALADKIFGGAGPAPGEIRSFELRFRHQEGSFRLLEGLATNLLDEPEVGGVVVNARDISERRHAEQALREREDELRQAQKMEAIGRLAGGVAHDFNNLLTVINGYSEFLLGGFDPGDPNHAYANEIRKAGERAVDLTRQLLAFSRRQVLQPALLNLNDIVRDTERMLGRMIGEDVQLVCRLDPAAGRVEADPNQLRQVLMNLAVNARDAMPGGGILTIETAQPESYARAASSGSPPGRYVTLAVGDTGEGMDEATMQRIFEPFFTTKEQGKGTGLGLSIVYGIVSQSGGWIAVDSAVGRGTTFRIFLPACAAQTALAEEASASAPVLEGTETVLLVEDEDDVRRFAATSLRAFGYRVLEAPDGEEALRLSALCTEPVDVLLTDVVMPGMTGVELSTRLQSLYPKMRVVFVSGHADSVILRHGVLETGVDLLQKPYTPALLATKVRQALTCAAPLGTGPISIRERHA